jgi:septum formation protein
MTHVQFHTLTDQEIVSYLGKIDPLDKAGAYAAQGHGSEIIEKIRGSYTNVVGLPMDETLAALRRFGITPAAAAGS